MVVGLATNLSVIIAEILNALHILYYYFYYYYYYYNNNYYYYWVLLSTLLLCTSTETTYIVWCPTRRVGFRAKHVITKRVLATFHRIIFKGRREKAKNLPEWHNCEMAKLLALCFSKLFNVQKIAFYICLVQHSEAQELCIFVSMGHNQVHSSGALNAVISAANDVYCMILDQNITFYVVS